MTKPKMEPIRVVLTKPVQVAYPTMFKSELDRKIAAGIKVDAWGGDLVLPNDHPDLPKIKEAIAKARAAKWPGRDFAKSPVVIPLKSGTEAHQKAKAKGGQKEWADGKLILRVKSSLRDQKTQAMREPPKVFRVVNGATVQTTNADDLRSGALVAAEIAFLGNDGNGSNIPDSVTAYVNSMVITGMGDPIGGRDMAAVYAAVLGSHTAENPLEGLEV